METLTFGQVVLWTAVVVVLFVLYTFYRIGKINSDFQKNCKIGDTCKFYIGEDFYIGTIKDIATDYIYIEYIELGEQAMTYECTLIVMNRDEIYKL